MHFEGFNHCWVPLWNTSLKVKTQTYYSWFDGYRVKNELKGCVTAVQFILFYFANYSPSLAMELKVGKDITCKWQNQRLETNKYVPWALFLKLQTAEINFEKLLGWTVFKIPNFNLFQSCSVLSISGSCCICCLILTCFKWLFLCFFL